MVTKLRIFLSYFTVLALIAISSTAGAIEPEGGLWVIKDENTGSPGRGFQLEAQYGTLVMSFYGYRANGSPVFYLLAGEIKNFSVNGITSSSITSALNEFSGGMQLGSTTYQAASLLGSVGNATLEFSDSRHGTIILPGEPSKVIQKFDFAAGETVTSTGFLPKEGLWVISAEERGEPGRGFQVETQANTMVVTFYGYGSDGRSTFYLAAGDLTHSMALSSTFGMFSGGTALGGTFKNAVANGSAGPVLLEFTSDSSGYVTLPGETRKAINKVTFAAPKPAKLCVEHVDDHGSYTITTCSKVALPYSYEEALSPVAPAIDSSGDITVVGFQLAAGSSPITITRVSAADVNGIVSPYILGLNEGLTIPAETTVEFKLKSPPTAKKTADLRYQFSINGTESFSYRVLFTSN